jgi:5-methylcytosine-specific restriction endonuclease McrA
MTDEPRLTPGLKAIREALWGRQTGRCALCGEVMPAARFEVAHATLWKKLRPTIDHVRPVSKGGGSEIDNLQLAHAVCNWRKGDAWRP